MNIRSHIPPDLVCFARTRCLLESIADSRISYNAAEENRRVRIGRVRAGGRRWIWNDAGEMKLSNGVGIAPRMLVFIVRMRVRVVGIAEGLFFDLAAGQLAREDVIDEIDYFVECACFCVAHLDESRSDLVIHGKHVACHDENGPEVLEHMKER